MDINDHTKPEVLERYAVYYSLVRLVIAAVSLFFGAMPVIYRVGSMSSFSSFLELAWLISGAASGYLLYRWYKAGQQVWGNKDRYATIAFFVLIISGLNLGYAAIGNNIGMSIVYGLPMVDLIFKATAVVYLLTAYYFWKSWQAAGERLF